MHLYADAPSRHGALHFKLRHARHHARPQRTTCSACERRRLCAPVEPEHGGDRYCLAECWPYQLGLVHGERAAARALKLLVDHDLDLAFHPGALTEAGWPRYRCDWCQRTARRFATEDELLEQGWRALGRDAHLCPRCQPGRPQLALAA